MRQNGFILVLSAGFAVINSIFAIDYLTTFCRAPVCIGGAQGSGSFLLPYSIPLSLASWTVFGVTLVWRQKVPSEWKGAGFDRDMFNLMMRMRGGASRLAILKLLTAPKHRNELSELAGFDWKEVDRQLGLLQNYGLVTKYAESGSVKLYIITKQGELLLTLIEKLGKGRTSTEERPSSLESDASPDLRCTASARGEAT